MSHHVRSTRGSCLKCLRRARYIPLNSSFEGPTVPELLSSDLVYLAERATSLEGCSIVRAMLRTDSGTTYRGAYGKAAPSSGLEIERRSSGTNGSSQQQDAAGLPPASPAQTSSVFMEKTYSGPFKEHTPTSLHRVSTEYAGPYGSGTKLNELDQAAGGTTTVLSAAAIPLAIPESGIWRRPSAALLCHISPAMVPSNLFLQQASCKTIKAMESLRRGSKVAAALPAGLTLARRWCH
ncbi:hypothetical protein WJX74_011103 [Apatococcus lobatus]|uniref:Uncharacterized protein n=1 Tax=Apatococcus lobatus TaxID=904363 RepID=A0AAW1QDT5_9CHLO